MDHLLRFSVIVPVYRHWHLVTALLDCLERQSVPAESFEVILVDNGSPDFAPPSDLPANTRIVRCHLPGSYAARNHGAVEAKGEWLAFTDADCLPSADWLAGLHAAAEHTDMPPLVAGPVQVVAVSMKPGPYEIYDIVKGIPQEHYFARGYAATANLAVRRTIFERLGGFDAARFSGGDADFCRRAARSGFRLAYAEEARVYHPARTSWAEISIKARRIKGGQLMGGERGRRRIWLLRTLNPPVLGALRFLRAKHHPLRSRSIAILVLMRIWGVELAEAARLKVGRPPERR